MAFRIMGVYGGKWRIGGRRFRASHTRPVFEAQAAFVLAAAVCGIALRSRVRRFESCWGSKIERLS